MAEARQDYLLALNRIGSLATIAAGKQFIFG